MRLKTFFVSTYIFIFTSTYAWNSTGHMMSGAIAFYYLKEKSPEVLFKVLSCLEYHPWYTEEWKERLSSLPKEQREVMLFMLASTYSDEARSIPELGGGEKKKWHYVDYPYVPLGDPTGGEPPQIPNAEIELYELFDSLKVENPSSEKAINFCWLFHILEDVHQPLHTVSLFDVDHPRGDRGGNDTYIEFQGEDLVMKLHSYWDGLISGNPQTIPEQAKNLLEHSEVTDTLARNFSDWIRKESVPLAVHVVYQNGKVRGTKDHPTVVTNAYDSEAQQTAYRQIVLAGVRLARKLIELYS